MSTEKIPGIEFDRTAAIESRRQLNKAEVTHVRQRVAELLEGGEEIPWAELESICRGEPGTENTDFTPERIWELLGTGEEIPWSEIQEILDESHEAEDVALD